MARDNSEAFRRNSADVPVVSAVQVRDLEEQGWTIVLGDLCRGFTAFHFTDEGEAMDFAEWAAGRVEGADTFDVLVTHSSIEARDLWGEQVERWKQQPQTKASFYCDPARKIGGCGTEWDEK